VALTPSGKLLSTENNAWEYIRS